MKWGRPPPQRKREVSLALPRRSPVCTPARSIPAFAAGSGARARGASKRKHLGPRALQLQAFRKYLFCTPWRKPKREEGGAQQCVLCLLCVQWGSGASRRKRPGPRALPRRGCRPYLSCSLWRKPIEERAGWGYGKKLLVPVGAVCGCG